MSQELDHVVERLTFLLRMHHKGSKVRRLTYRSLPLINERMFDNVSLSRIISPTVPKTSIEAEQLFDAFLYPAIEGGDPGEELACIGGEELTEWVMRGETFGEQAVRLLFAVSNLDGVRRVFDDKTFLVMFDDRTFGIKGGRVESRFCTGLEMEVRPADILTRTVDVRSFDHNFCSLYREAYRRGGKCLDAIVALHMLNPKFNFKKMADRSRVVKTPTAAKMASWERTLLTARDPIVAMYPKLVPVWMNSSEFRRVFGNIEKRKINPSEMEIAALTGRLHHHFYRNKEQQK
jgi:hypothetical protein